MQPCQQTISQLTGLKRHFFTQKMNKCPGYDEISFNVFKNCFSELNIPIKYLFEMSLEGGIFPDKLKTAFK